MDPTDAEGARALLASSAVDDYKKRLARFAAEYVAHPFAF